MRFITIPRRTRSAPEMVKTSVTTRVRDESDSSGAIDSSDPLDASTADPGHPRLVGQYLLERAIGAGGQGDVFAARDTLLLRPVALKRLRHATAEDSDVHLIEARRSAGLRHAAFVRIHGVVKDDGGHWIVMERVFGRELSAVLRDGPLSLPLAVDLVRQAAQALSEVHQARLAHGDIKPSNLMLQADGDLRILDFGIAQPFDATGCDTANAGAQAGTLAYMAPERLAGASPSPASDIYALGAVFLELVGGHRRRSMDPSAVEAADDGVSWQFPGGLTQPLIHLVRAMGAPDPQARPASMDAVVSALDQLPVGPHGTPRRQTTSSIGRAGLRAALLLVALAAAVSGDLPAPPGATANRSVPNDAQEMHAGIDALRRFDEDGAVARALAHFKTVADRTPRHAAAWAWLALAQCLSYRNDGHDETLLRHAREAATRAITLDGQLAAAHAADGWTLELQGDRSGAVTRFERALRLDPDNSYALTGRTRVLMAQGKSDAAFEAASAARERHPDDRLYVDLVGWLHFERGEFAAAEREFRASIRLQPDAVFAYANLNATLLRLGRPEEALQVLQQGLQIRPAGRLYTNLGNALYARGDYASAAEAFRAAAEGPHGSPNFYLRWANLADALRWTPGEAKASAEAYRRALQLFQPILARDPSPANVSRAALYQARLGMRTEATAGLSTLQEQAPDKADPNFRMALAHEALGQRAQALQSLRRALVLGYPLALVKTEPEFAALRQDIGYSRSIDNLKEELRHDTKQADR
ncbi:protein kinase domain-containing protein [Roseateles chitinivorans]|uniref:serine/threonine-protein kinase n=1 Tax=Roseateles chitinivorans TaxID=2917965 RepID=UPI003D67C0F6